MNVLCEVIRKTSESHSTEADGKEYLFQCPGCKCLHSFSVGNKTGPSWTWNGSMDKPTFTPSLLYPINRRCHSFVRDGEIVFLNDCFHELAGKTVPLSKWEDS